MRKPGYGSMVFAALFCLGAVHAKGAVDDPGASVREAYALTVRSFDATGDEESPQGPRHREQLMSKRLARLFAHDDQYMDESGNVGNLDYDPFIGGQDGSIDKLKVSVASQSGDKATVFADFLSFGEPVRVEFAMVRENGRWVIDDISNTTDGESFKAGDLLSQPYDCGSFIDKPCRP